LTPFFWHVSTGVKPESKGGSYPSRAGFM
jgi:hypothetical protein